MDHRMSNQQTRSIANRLAAGWQSRLQHLETVLHAESIPPLAWRWRIELRTLRFLLSRYGDDPSIEDLLESHHGKIARLVYDCFGDFEGFVLDTCGEERSFDSREPAIEELVQHACCKRIPVTVFVHPDDPRRPRRIELHCV